MKPSAAATTQNTERRTRQKFHGKTNTRTKVECSGTRRTKTEQRNSKKILNKGKERYGHLIKTGNTDRDRDRERVREREREKEEKKHLCRYVLSYYEPYTKYQ